MNNQNNTITKLAETALLAALCYVAFTFLQIKIPVPGGDATSIHIGNAFCVLGALLLGGWYGGLAGAIGMTVADLMDPVYITGAPKTFILKLCIGLITGLVAHKIAKINESTDKKYVFKWSVLASVAGLAFNVVADPVVGYSRAAPENGRGSGKDERNGNICQCSNISDPCCSDIQCGSPGADKKPSSGGRTV